MAFVPITFSTPPSVAVFQPGAFGSVTSTVGNNAGSFAAYPQMITALRIDYSAPNIPGLVLTLATAQTGRIDLSTFTPPIVLGPNTGVHTGVVNGITVTIQGLNTGSWGQGPFGSNPAGSLIFQGGFPIVELTFSQPVTGLTLRGWGAWSGGTDDVTVTAELTPQQPIPCDCCPTGPPRCSSVTGEPVFPCRRPSGAIEWHTADGGLIAAADVINC